MDKLEPGQVELIEAYYRRKPEAALKLESPELPSVPNLSQSGYRTAFNAFEALLAALF